MSSQQLIDSIALEAKLLSGWSSSEIPREHARNQSSGQTRGQAFLWEQLPQDTREQWTSLSAATQTPDTSSSAPVLGSDPNSLPAKKDSATPDMEVGKSLVPQSSWAYTNYSPYEPSPALVTTYLVYTPEQRAFLLRHIEKRWGASHVVVPQHAVMSYVSYMSGQTEPQIQFEIRCIPAHLSHQYFDLYFTIGVGAYPMAVPEDNKENRRVVELERVEFMTRLPPLYAETAFRNMEPNGDGWVLLLLRSLALKVLHSHQYYGRNFLNFELPQPYVTYQQSFKAAPCMQRWPEMAGCILIEPQEYDVTANLCKLPQSTHHLIRLVGVLPLYKEELELKESVDLQGRSGGRALMRELRQRGFEPWLASLKRPHYLA